MLQISVLIKAQPSIPNTTDLMHTNIPPYKGAYIFPKNVQDNTSKSYCRSLSTSKSYLQITEVLNKHMQNCRFSHSVIQESGEMSRGGAAGMGGERTMGGKGAHLGYCWWPAGRGSSRGRAGRRRQVDDEQDRRRASRGRAWTSRGGAGPAVANRRRVGDELQSLDEQGRSRGEAEEEQDWREEQERRAGGGGPAAGTSEWRPLPSNPPALPSNPPALPSCGRTRAWRHGNSSRAPIWHAKIGRARAHLARLRAASAPAERAYAPPRAA